MQEEGKKLKFSGDNFFSQIALWFMLIMTIDFIGSATLWLAAGYNIGLVDYLSIEFTNYTFNASLVDVVTVSFGKNLFASVLFWLSVPGTMGLLIQTIVLVMILIPAGMSIAKIALILLYGSFEHAIGIPAINIALHAFLLFFSLVELIFAFYALIARFCLTSAKENIGYEPLHSHKSKKVMEFGDVNEHQVERKVLSGDESESHADVIRVASLAVPELPLLVGATVALIVAALTSLAVPYYFGEIIGALSYVDPTKRAEKVRYGILSLILFSVITAVGSTIRGILFTLAGQRLVARLRCLAFNTIISQDIAFFDKQKTGELTNRLAADTQVLQNALTVNVSMALRNLITACGALVLLFLSSWKLTLMMLAVVPIIVGAGTVFARYLKSLTKQFQDFLAKSNSTAEEAIGGIRTVRSFACDDKVNDTYSRDVEESYEIGKKYSLVLGSFVGIVAVVAQAAIVLVVWYGGQLVINGQMNTGDLLSFLLYTLTVAASIAVLSNSFGEYAGAVGAAERIFEIIDITPLIPIQSTEGAIIPPSFAGNISLKDVTFSYASRPDSSVLKNFSLNVQGGTTVALVGPSGGGKSTVVSLIERFYDPVEGAVALDGIDIRDLDPEWYRKQIALVAQEPTLFATTIRENIALGGEFTEDEIIAAAKNANAYTFITGFPNGLETLVGERGIQLSGGQKQRIAIARAMILNPKILLLDEATSALDAESEFLVQEALDRLLQGNTTVIIVAHRLSTIKNADQVVVISEGKIVQKGTHQELIEEKGQLYEKLVKQQMENSSSLTPLKSFSTLDDDSFSFGEGSTSFVSFDGADTNSIGKPRHFRPQDSNSFAPSPILSDRSFDSGLRSEDGASNASFSFDYNGPVPTIKKKLQIQLSDLSSDDSDDNVDLSTG